MPPAFFALLIANSLLTYYSEYAMFEPFMKPENFRRVYLDGQHCVAWDIDPSVDSEKVWSNKVDLCPDSCYIDSVPLGGAADA